MLNTKFKKKPIRHEKNCHNLGFGDFVPGDAVLNAETKDGTYKLILACLYVLVGK